MANDCTKLKYVTAKDLDTIVEWVNMLPYKIEIKGGFLFAKGKYVLAFVSSNEMGQLGIDLDG